MVKVVGRALIVLEAEIAFFRLAARTVKQQDLAVACAMHLPAQGIILRRSGPWAATPVSCYGVELFPEDRVPGRHLGGFYFPN